MHFEPADIPDSIVIEPDVYEDDRGFFTELFNAGTFKSAGIAAKFVQENLSRSRRGVLRGMHYQVRRAQGKLIGVLSGEVFDVALDIRRSSATFGKWFGVNLSADTQRQLWIPPGFAHGFYVLSESADVRYLATDLYAPQWERTILWNDPAIGIRWPLTDCDHPILSQKDAEGMLLSMAELFD